MKTPVDSKLHKKHNSILIADFIVETFLASVNNIYTVYIIWTSVCDELETCCFLATQDRDFPLIGELFSSIAFDLQFFKKNSEINSPVFYWWCYVHLVAERVLFPDTTSVSRFSSLRACPERL